MKILFWNIRGIGNASSQVTLHSLCQLHKPDLIFIAEPMILFEQISGLFWKNLNVSKFCMNSRINSVPSLWGSSWSPIVIFTSSQCIVLEFLDNSNKFYVAAIYASTAYLQRRYLWNDLSHLQDLYVGPWIFVGDFNVVLGAHEKQGRRPPPRISCEDFISWTNAYSLSHLPTTGVQLSWNNGRLRGDYVAQRLDRTICNMHGFNLWQTVSCCTLVRHASDHHPLLISNENSVQHHALPFKFFKAWLAHDDCSRLVLETWQQPAVGSPMSCLQQKLKRLKRAFKEWNKVTFGNIHSQVSVAIDEVTRLQNIIDSGSITDEIVAQDYHAQLILSQALLQHDQFWKEKARVQHFMNGDRNTSYFHRVARVKAATKQIFMIKHGDTIFSDPMSIEGHILDYFTGIFHSPNHCAPNDMVSSCILTLVTPEDNDMLCKVPTALEIKTVVFDMNVDGAPGPDGFGGHFYHHFWDVVATDVVLAVQEFFVQGKLLPNLNSNLIVLIPKVPGADNMGDFRPIVLANFQFKIITKILADRLSIIVAKIVSEQQRGFIHGRQISDCVIIASEAINVLHRKSFAGNIV
jgi:hypothetical protein